MRLIAVYDDHPDPPDDVDSRYREAEVAANSNRLTDAARILSELSDRYPKEALFHWRLGYVHADAKATDRAIASFNRAIQIDTNCWPAWGGLAYIFLELRDWEQAEDCLRRRIAIKPSPQCFVLLAVALRSKGDIEGAIQSCKTAIELDPRFDEAYYNLGIYYAMLERTDDSQRAFSAAVELNPAYANTIDDTLAKAEARKRLNGDK
jgi:tetratricopeptide (TPR) repeat protein